MRLVSSRLIPACLILAIVAQADAADWASFEFVFVGKLEGVKAGPVARSYPPQYHHTLTFKIEKVLRGNLNVGQTIDLFNIAHQVNPPVFPQGKSCLVAGASTFSGRMVRWIEEANETNVAAAEAECRLPVGWTTSDGKPVSPWGSLGQAAWPKAAGNLGAAMVCSVTGRPALLCGEGVQLTATPLPPKKSIKWVNPDGDGEYKLTVTNTTDKPLRVPALLTDGKEILWQNSVVILCQGKAYPAPGYRTDLTKVQPVTLQPGQSVSGEINPLALEGPQWPQGGYRIGFQFCLGEKSVSHEFYYYTSHHGKIREALRKAKTATSPKVVVVQHDTRGTPGPVKPGPARTVSWDELKAAIQKGTVASVSQTHSLHVTVTMSDGQTYHATEPAIDEIFKLLKATGKTPPVMMTE